MPITKEKQSIENLAKKLQVVSDPNRLKILCYLFTEKKACVSDIAKNLSVSVATASYHLQALDKEGLLEPKREGKKICYTVSKVDLMADLIKFICKHK